MLGRAGPSWAELVGRAGLGWAGLGWAGPDLEESTVGLYHNDRSYHKKRIKLMLFGVNCRQMNSNALGHVNTCATPALISSLPGV